MIIISNIKTVAIVENIDPNNEEEILVKANIKQN
jgi:hypothetical protein